MRQYEIWWADLPAPVGRRPVLLLTRSPAYGYLNKAIVAEITTTIRGSPIDNIHVVAKHLLSSRVGVLAAAREREVKRALGYALDGAELKTL